MTVELSVEKLRALVEIHRLRASRRQLVLLETGTIRTVPFRPTGETVWQSLPTFGWFKQSMEDLPYLRAWREWSDFASQEVDAGRPWPAFDRPITSLTPVIAHDMIDVLENSLDGNASDDDSFLCREYFRQAERSAEAQSWDEELLRQGSLVWHKVADRLKYCFRSTFEHGCALDMLVGTSEFDFTNYGAGDDRWPLHPHFNRAAVGVMLDLFPDPLRPVAFDSTWINGTTVGLARKLYDIRDFSAMPFLADALEDAGCENTDVLNHCRRQAQHVRGCWVVDNVLGRN